MALLLGVAAAREAQAITDEDVYRVLRFPFVAASARATAMGGTGLASIDDPAAARINPARLTALAHPQILLQARGLDLDGVSDSSGLRLLDPDTNPFAGTTFSASGAADTGVTPSFIGYAFPLRFARPLVIGISRTELLAQSVTARSESLTTPLSAPVTPVGGDEVLRISRGRLDLDLDLYDVAAGWRLTPGFSMGGSLVVGRLDLSAETTGLLADPLQFTRVGMVDPRFTTTSAEPLVRTISNGSDTDLAFTFGTVWKPHPTLTVATTYRQGPRFRIASRSLDLSSGRREEFTNTIKVPDAAAAGLAWTPFSRRTGAGLPSLTFALDVERVEYSDLLEGLREGENVLARPDFVKSVSYTVSDATEVRFGVEYERAFLTWTLALRGGLYTEHDSRLRLRRISGDVGALEGQSEALRKGGFFPKEDTELHVTLGAGARFYKLSIDVGVDLSDPMNQVVASAAYRFR